MTFYLPLKMDVLYLPETNISATPKNGWLEYDPFLLGFGLFSCAARFREGSWKRKRFPFGALCLVSGVNRP